jgi:hypothetical protein
VRQLIIQPKENKMDRYEKRIKGTVVHLLDPIKTATLIKSRYSNQDTEIKAEPMVVVNGRNGLATVVSEGVGWYADENGKLPVNYYAGDFNSGYQDITVEELMPLISDETIDLADFVRIFGDRLETNLSLWQNYAKGYEQSMSVATATIR